MLVPLATKTHHPTCAIFLHSTKTNSIPVRIGLFAQLSGIDRGTSISMPPVVRSSSLNPIRGFDKRACDLQTVLTSALKLKIGLELDSHPYEIYVLSVPEYALGDSARFFEADLFVEFDSGCVSGEDIQDYNFQSSSFRKF